VSRIPREARDGMMRAWLEILRERHPGVSWVPVEQKGKKPPREYVQPKPTTRVRTLKWWPPWLLSRPHN
jgi:hypothetical protein